MAAGDADPALRRALERIAAEDLPALVEEARLDAREQVKARLTEGLVEAMLAQTRAQSSGVEEREKAETALYAYCVTAAEVELPAGLDSVNERHPPTVVVHGPLATVVSEVPLADFAEETLPERLANMAWLARTARRHEAVIEAVAEHTTLIPMRMCTVYRDESGVTDMLAREATALSEALADLAGKAEWGVKVFASSGMPADGVPEGEPLPAAASGTDYMRRRRSARDERRRRCERLHDAPSTSTTTWPNSPLMPGSARRSVRRSPATPAPCS